MNVSESTAVSARSAGAESRTISYFHWAGYALLLLALLDSLEALVPPGFMNPVWELQFMGGIIERSPVALLGFMLVFHGEWGRRASWERWVLPTLSWLALGVALAFVLMIPLMVVNTFRVENSGEKQINAQLDQQITQARAAQEILANAQGDNLDALLRRSGRAAPGTDAEAVRTEMLAELNEAEKQLQRRAEEARASQKLELHKRTYKHSVQAAVLGIVLGLYWWRTGWARKSKRS